MKTNIGAVNFLSLYDQETYKEILDFLMSSDKLKGYWSRNIAKSRSKLLNVPPKEMAEQVIENIHPSEIANYFEPEGFVVCCDCGHWIHEGYCVELSEYYCSEECLHKHYTEDQYLKMLDRDEAYYTSFE